MANNEYDLADAFRRIENELMASMIRNMDRHRAEETKEGYNWSMWQVEQLKALERYKRKNQKKYQKQFKSINSQIEQLIRRAHERQHEAGNQNLAGYPERMEDIRNKQISCT